MFPPINTVAKRASVINHAFNTADAVTAAVAKVDEIHAAAKTNAAKSDDTYVAAKDAFVVATAAANAALVVATAAANAALAAVVETITGDAEYTAYFAADKANKAN